jgi:tetratricopeptide (TPR) repeat protein
MRVASFALAALVIGAGFPSGLARAADTSKEEARQHYRKGEQLFDVGRWDEAAAEFEQAYALKSDPIFIYNMAQAYRRKGEAKRALELYKNFLIKAPNTPKRAEVEERIAALQEQVEQANRAAKSAAPAPAKAAEAAPAPPPLPPPAAAPAPPPLPPPAAAPAPPPLPPPAAAPAQVEAPAAPVPATSSPGRGLRVTGIVLGAAGVAFVGAGLFFSLETDDYNNSVQTARVYQPNLDDRGKVYNTLQWVGYGLGAGLLATGAILYGVGASSAKTGAVALAPALLPGGAGVSAQGAF